MKLRKEASIDLRSAIDGAIYRVIESAYQSPFRSCLSCINFRQKTEICGLCNERPPARIIVTGCDQYEDINEVPF